jgi:hypothetical protein
MVHIQEFARKLSAIPENEFTLETVLSFLQSHPVDVASLSPYL